MKVELKRKDEFHKALENYEPSEEAKQTLGRIKLVILLGITGAGRNTIINHLVDTERYHYIVSDTTRPPKVRDGKLEENGIQYYFRSEDEVLADIKAGKYLEAEVLHEQQVSGISIRELEQSAASGKISINEVDFLGTVNIMKYKPDAFMFFIVPPSFDEWLRRLNSREEMSDQEFRNRAKTAVHILEQALGSDKYHFVINDSSMDSAIFIDRWVHGDHDPAHDLATREIAKEILVQLKAHLDV